MGERRYKRCTTVADILSGERKKRKRNGKRKMPQIPKSPTHMRFFEQGAEQRKTAAQVRRSTKKLFGESPNRPTVDNYRQLLHEQMLSNIPEGTKDKRSELLEIEAFLKAKLQAEEDQETEGWAKREVNKIKGTKKRIADSRLTMDEYKLEEEEKRARIALREAQQRKGFMLHKLPQSNKPHELLEAEADKELEGEKLKHSASQVFEAREEMTHGDRQLGRKIRSREKRAENKHTRDRKAA